MGRQVPVYKDQAPKPNLYSFFFVLILLLAAFLRFYCLTCSSLWHDEGNTWALMGRSYAEIAAAAAADIHPPGYYWLLKAWTSLFGADSFGLRSFSAVTGVATVAIVYAIGRQIVISDQWSVISGPRSVVRGRWSTVSFPLLAAFLAAVNPFQIFYSQEARMYALLALESAILFWAVRGQLAVGSKQLAEKRKSEKAEKRGSEGERERGSEQATRTTHYVIYFVAAAAGLWTHYSFPVVIAAAVLAYSWQWLRLWKLSVISDQSSVISYQSPIPDPRSPVPSPQSPIPDPRSPVPDPRSPIPSPQSPVPSPQSPIPFLAVNALALLAFLPWLPTAVDRVLNWPAGGDVVSLAEGIRLTVQTLLIGPIRTAPDLDWPWLLLAGGAPILGIWALRRTSAGITLGVWLLAPILLMFGLGLFSDAFLKFLIIAAPVWSLLTAAAPFALPKKSFTDASTLQRFNASRLQGFNASTLQRFNASTLQRFNASSPPRLPPHPFALPPPRRRDAARLLR